VLPQRSPDHRTWQQRRGYHTGSNTFRAPIEESARETQRGRQYIGSRKVQINRCKEIPQCLSSTESQRLTRNVFGWLHLKCRVDSPWHVPSRRAESCWCPRTLGRTNQLEPMTFFGRNVIGAGTQTALAAIPVTCHNLRALHEPNRDKTD
jgi:hypothetical protein